MELITENLFYAVKFTLQKQSQEKMEERGKK